MDPAFAWIEATSVSAWLRGSDWAFPVVLIFHTVGLAFLVGANIVIDVRALGLAPGVPFRSLERYFVVMWLGFWVNAASGVALLAAYPTKALTNPVFYVKLAAIAAGLVAARAARRYMRADADVLPGRLKAIAAVSLACWAIGITTGRLLAYTHTRLLVDELA
jgi:hypothetical protein